MMSSDHEPLQASGEHADLDSKSGITLAEAYARFVEHDAASQVLRDSCELWCPRWAEMWVDQSPGYKLVPVSRVATGVLQRPQAFVISPVFEEWPSPRSASWEAARSAGFIVDDPGEDDDCVPDEIVELQERRHELTKALIQRFRDKELVAKGIVEHPAPSPHLTHDTIESPWWCRRDLLVGFKANALFLAVKDRTELLFSDVRVTRSESVRAAADGEVAHATGATPKVLTRVSDCWKGLPDETKARVVPRGGKKAIAQKIQCLLRDVPLATVERELRNVLKVPDVKSELQDIWKAQEKTGKK